MGRPTVVSDSLVSESNRTSVSIPSSARHEKPGVNPRGPPRKAKYYWTTDSAIVARAKGEKYPC